MALPQVVVRRGVTNSLALGPGPEIENVQGLNLRAGRTRFTSDYAVGGGTIQGRVPGDLPALAVGDGIVVEITTDSDTVYLQFWLRDFRIEYGVVESEDVWFIEVEDILGRLGREIGSASWDAGDVTSTAARGLSSSFSFKYFISDLFNPTGSKVSAQSLSDVSLLTVFNQIARTEQGLFFTAQQDNLSIQGGYWVDRVQILGRATTIPASDDGTGTDPILYQLPLVFASIAEDYVDKVIVNPEGLATQTSGTGEYVWELSTYDETTTQASDLAEYLLSIFDAQDQVPREININLRNQTNDKVLLGLIDVVILDITFRTTNQKALVIGYELSLRPDSGDLKYYLQGLDTLNYFVLNNATFGKLDENKLGF
jgi:hypothetical protein